MTGATLAGRWVLVALLLGGAAGNPACGRRGPLEPLDAGVGDASVLPRPAPDAGQVLVLRRVKGAAVAQHIDIGHTGNQDEVSFVPPLRRQWTVDLGGEVSYPLIVEDRVFVTTSLYQPPIVTLHALDRRTGRPVWGLVELGRGCHFAGAAYDAGSVFVCHCANTLSAFDAVSGKALWSIQETGIHGFHSVPTAAGGLVFLQGAGVGAAAFAVDGVTGAVRWESSSLNGTSAGAPAVAEDGLYVAQSCLHAYRLEPFQGLLAWHHDSDCGGGGGLTSPLYQGKFYVRSALHTPGVVVDARTGLGQTRFPVHGLPAFDGNRGFFLDWPSYPLKADASLKAIDLSTNTTLWAFAGDGQLGPSPIVANHRVYIASRRGELFAVDAATGAVLWTDTLGSQVANSDQASHEQPPTGLAAGSEMLIVPAGRTLVGYQ